MFKGTDKVEACLSPTLELLVTYIDNETNRVYVETGQTRTKLVLVHEKDKYVLRKFDIHGNVAGRVLNNWQLCACASDRRLMSEIADRIQRKRGLK